MKRTVALLAGITATVIALAMVDAQEAATPAAVESADSAEQSQSEDRYAELVKERGEFQETWLLPGVNFGQYDKVYFWRGEFEYRDVGPARKTRSTMMSTRNEEYGISEEDRKKFEEVVSDVFRKEVLKGKNYTVLTDVDGIDSKTLIARGGLLDIVSKVPPEMVGRADIYLSSIGAATFVIELIEARSGNVVALVAERREAETMNARGAGFATPANSATILGDIRRWAGSLSRRMRQALDKAIGESKTS